VFLFTSLVRRSSIQENIEACPYHQGKRSFIGARLLVLYTAVDTDFPTHPPPCCLLVQKAKNLGCDLWAPERFPGVSVPFCSDCPIRGCTHKPLSARLASVSGCFFSRVDLVHSTYKEPFNAQHCRFQGHGYHTLPGETADVDGVR